MNNHIRMNVLGIVSGHVFRTILSETIYNSFIKISENDETLELETLKTEELIKKYDFLYKNRTNKIELENYYHNDNFMNNIDKGAKDRTLIYEIIHERMDKLTVNTLYHLLKKTKSTTVLHHIKDRIEIDLLETDLENKDGFIDMLEKLYPSEYLLIIPETLYCFDLISELPETRFTNRKEVCYWLRYNNKITYEMLKETVSVDREDSFTAWDNYWDYLRI